MMSVEEVVKKIDLSLIKSGFLDTIDHVLCDCDGVLWNGDTAIPGSLETLRSLKSKGKKVLLVTNNGSKTREEYAIKCSKLGYEISPDEIFTSAYSLSHYLASKNFQKKVYIIGRKAIQQELAKVKISSLPVGPEPMTGDRISLAATVQLDPEVRAVVVGLDEEFSYPKLLKACSYLTNPDCLFLATNVDEAFPAEGEIIVPGTGPIVAAIKNVTKRDVINCGKPETPIFDAIKHSYPELKPNRCIMIGDRLDSDICLGKNNNMRTVLVLTGTSNLKDVEELKKSKKQEDQLLVPDYYLPRLGDLGKLIDAC